jgi:hypothetical protein
MLPALKIAGRGPQNENKWWWKQHFHHHLSIISLLSSYH